MPTELQARMLRTIDKAQLALALAGKVDYVYGYSFILTNLDVSTPAKLVGGTLSCAGCGIPAVNRCAFGVLEGVERVLSTSKSDTADTRADSNGAVEQSVDFRCDRHENCCGVSGTLIGDRGVTAVDDHRRGCSWSPRAHHSTLVRRADAGVGSDSHPIGPPRFDLMPMTSRVALDEWAPWGG